MVAGSTIAKSSARTVEDYIAGLASPRSEAIASLRRLAKAHLVGFTEGIEYGMPYYRGPGGSGLGFASQASYIALYAGPRAAARAKKSGLDVGVSCIRFRNAQKIDWTLVEELFRISAAER